MRGDDGPEDCDEVEDLPESVLPWCLIGAATGDASDCADRRVLVFDRGAGCRGGWAARVCIWRKLTADILAVSSEMNAAQLVWSVETVLCVGLLVRR